MTKALLLAVGWFVTGVALAQQAPQPVPAPAPDKPAATAPRPLNLKLDQPARMFVQETAPERKGDADGLPTLGGGSLNFERQPRDMRPDSSGKYPMDVEKSRHQ
jgi:hypothetical protein